MDRPLIYLASPYSHPDEWVRNNRYVAARDALRDLLAAGVLAYSPIVHTHWVGQSLPTDWEFWRGPSLGMLSRCDCLLVLMRDGTNESIGIGSEVDYARSQGIPVHCWNREQWTARQMAERLECVKRMAIQDGTGTTPAQRSGVKETSPQ